MAGLREQLDRIFKLSRFDQECRQFQERQALLPGLREEIESGWILLQKNLEEKKGILVSVEKERRDKEMDLRVSQESLKKRETRVNEIKTNKEYQAALKEVSQGKKENKEMEDHLLKLMGQIEELTKEVSVLEEQYRSSEASHRDKYQALVQEEEELGRKLGELSMVRNGLLDGIGPSLIVQYEKVRKIRSDPLALVEGGTCLGCHMHVPPQLFNQILRQQAIYTCPSCHRILSIKEKEGLAGV
ncbi:MAG: hypothetical protein HYS22_06990 [Deltaproteobacteria bacterium]|nr:hypothetical protein [Deltaproteobacteria bacterium]